MSNRDMADLVKPGFTQTSQEEYLREYIREPNPDGFWDLWGWFDHPCAAWRYDLYDKNYPGGRYLCPAGCSNYENPCPRGYFHAAPCGYCRREPQYWCGEKDMRASKSNRDFGVPYRKKGTYHPDDPGCEFFIQWYAPPGSRNHAETYQRNYTPYVAGLLAVSAGLSYLGWKAMKAR